MQKESVVCRRCGTADDYYTEVRANNHCAYCNKCGGFIKNIPYSEPTFYFGRYKGMKVSELVSKQEDLPYLLWAQKEIKDLNKRMREAISEQIELLQKLP